ncbi:cell adhesion molecule DSCAM-like isoform X2 [Saccostrea cucullata]|uniref:cell adhesion molecule DSCAM-like isoform X2 n=1 Tax=Saccostrea cuccullata TaxID=36930 RepID=UPI002ED3E14D
MLRLSQTALVLAFLLSSIKARTTESPFDIIGGPIFLTEPPSSLPFANTKGASVQCTAHGRPAPTLDWVKEDDTPVEDVPGILQILPNNTLFFHPFQRNDFRNDVHASSYKCIAYNSGGRISSRSMRVKAVLVEDYLTYNLQLSDVWSVRGSTAVFKCNINPFFVKDYIHVVGWSKGTKSIQAGDRVSILSDGELHIRDIRDEDRYTTYKCVARNILTGDEKFSKMAYLHVHEPPAGWTPPKIDDVMTHVTVNEGETVELPCVASSNPLPKYRWSHQNKELVIDSVNKIQRAGNLVIVDAKVTDSGTYTCNSSNSHGSATGTTQLTVQYPLSATIDPQQQKVDSNQSAVFNCTVLGHPIKSVFWLKDGFKILPNQKFSIKDQSVLTIHSVNKKDQGMYQCVVKNEETSSQGTAQLLLGAAHPTFVETFVDQYVQTGQKTAIRCIATGNPTPEITWKLDGEQLKVNSDIKIGSFLNPAGDVVSYVNISSVHLQYGGEYQCVSSNEVGTIYHVGQMFVYGVPFVRQMQNVTATAGENLSIRCYVAGYPVAQVTWSKGRESNVLPQNHRQKVVNETLFIEKVQKTHDIGEYICTAKNSNGQGMSRSVYVSVLEPPMIDPFRFPRKKQGDRIVVSCVVSTGDQPLDIVWTKDGEVIPPDMGIHIQKLNSYMTMLSIGDANPKHNGNYTCRASNAAATTNYTATLHVDVPPRWVMEPGDSFVILKNSVSLDCLTTGTPVPMITWKKALGSRPGHYRMINYVENDTATTASKQLLSNGTLIIRGAREEDHGYYLCHSYNDVGPGLSKVIFLRVHIPARFDEKEKNYTVIKGQNKTLDCQAIGDQPLSVTWSFNAQTLSTAGMDRRRMVNTVVTSRGKLSTLTLRPAERGDTGFYVCTAKNKFGNAVLAMRLVVLEPPEPPKNLTLINKTSRSIKVKWQAPYDGNSPILYYAVQYKVQKAVWQGVISNVTVSSLQLITSISDLHPAYVYEVRVVANNSIGYGNASKSILVQLDEEQPSGPPTEVKVKAIGSESLQISWMPPLPENQNGEIQGYYIGYKERDSQSRFIYITKSIDGEFLPSVDIHNLEKFTEYTVHVQAYNQKGRGPPSPDSQVFTLEDVPSQPPQGVQATAINSRSIKVVWSPPPLFTLHGILQGYKIYYKPVRFDEDESDANAVVSSELEATITGLSKYTNYSLQVLAFTRKGEGVRCSPLFVLTQQDAPERPADIKALPVNNSTVMVSWKPPLHSNGILTKYNVYIYNGSSTEMLEKVELPPIKTSYYMSNLSLNEEIQFEVSANTIIGEGERTHSVSTAPQERVAARIASFSAVMLIPWQHTLTLQCLAVGDPTPSIQWKIRGRRFIESERIQILKNGSLHINGVLGSDAANYSCRATNKYGSDEVNYAISVQVSDKLATPPKPPSLYVVATTTSTIQINWRSGSNGGSPIQGFVIHHKKDHETWQKIEAGPTNRTQTVTGLLCGTTYKFYINALNRLGYSPNSDTISVKTNGSTPIMPPQSMLLKVINVTSVDLDLTTWITSGCPIRFFSVQYKVWEDTSWTEASNNVQSNKTVHTVEDLHPATWYVMKVVAHSDAGSTESELKFATLTYHGRTITPLFITKKEESSFYEKTYIMIPLCFGIVVSLIIIIAVLLYLRRRRELIQMKESASNLRRDITAETSLMNDLDKRFNFDFEGGNSEPYGKRNVNLLISFNSDENLHNNSPTWLNNGSSKTNSDNGSINRSDDDGNINPYATFNQVKQVILEKEHQPPEREKSPEFDDISLQKLEAQKAILSPSEPYVPFFHAKGDNGDVAKDPHPPLIPLKTTEGYDNQGLILSPRKYASADQIHALFTQAPVRPHSSYSKSQKCPSHSHGSSDEKGSQRQSIISSVTTVSSSRDELLEALENAKHNPLPPVVYESPPDSSSQPTDSSVGTEPGIVKFTQSPPKPNEQREASCEVHYTSDLKPSIKRSRKEAESDTTECETNERPTQPRRIKGRRNKQRGQLAKRQVVPGYVPRTHSRTSTTSSEEVTYTFSGRQSPHSPPEGYMSYMPDQFPESDRPPVRRGRRTPHAKVKYDLSLQTPGTDESRPLVMAVAQPSMSSPNEEEEDSAAVSLLNRHYRPVEAEEGENKGQKKPRDRGYREDYTLV